MAITIKLTKPTVVATYKNPKTRTTYNPQRTVSPQPRTYNPQPATTRPIQYTYNPQPAYRYVPPTYAVARAQAAARQRAITAANFRKIREAELRRQRELAKKREAERKLKVARANAQKELKVRKEKTEMQRFAEWQSLNAKILAGKSVDERVKLYFELTGAARGKDAEGKQTFMDWLTGDFFRQTKGRTEAQAMAGDLQKDIDTFEESVKKFEAEKAAREQRLLWLAQNGTQEQFMKYYTEANNWAKMNSRTLTNDAYRIDSLSKGYEKYFTSGKSGWLADTGKGVFNAQEAASNLMGGLLKYTIGAGGEKVPSLFTAPRRLLAFAGNLGRKKGDKIYTLDGAEKEYTGSPWASTLRQSLVDVKQAQKFDFEKAKKQFSDEHKFYVDSGRKRLPLSVQSVQKMPEGLSEKEFYEKRWQIQQNAETAMSRVSANLADPIYAGKFVKQGFNAVGKIKGVQAAGAFAKNTKIANALKSGLSTVKNSRLGQGVAWWGKDYVSPKSGEVIKAGQKAQPHWVEAKRLAGQMKRTYKTVGQSTKDKFAFWKQQRGKEAQYYTKAFAGKDEKVIYLAQQLLFNKARATKNFAYKGHGTYNVGTKLNPKLISFKGMSKDQIREALRLRDHLEDLGSHYYNAERSLGAKMKSWYRANDIDVPRKVQQGLRYKPRDGYIPNNARIGAGGKFTEKLAKKLKIGHLMKYDGYYMQDPQRLARSLAQRMYSHNQWKHTYVQNPKFVNAMEQTAGRMATSAKTAKAIQREGVPTIRNTFRNIKNNPQSWQDRTLTNKLKFGGSAVYESVGKLPMKTWKASVLALRPAWAVNNAGYNTIAGAMAAGPRFFKESAKMLRRGGLTAAREANPEVVTKLPQYFGAKNNFLYKPSGALEDWARLSTFKALKSKGYTDEAALKKLNSTLFDYSTKNWEVPLKAAVPFWAWHKGLAKLSTRMPFEHPFASKIFHENMQRNERAWESIPEDSRDFYAGRQYLWNDADGNPQFMNTPFMPFNQSEFSNISLNPFLSALKQLSLQKDQFGNELDDKRIFSVFASHFPQVPLARKAYDSWLRAKGDTSTAIKYFSEVGSHGYPLTKWRQGDDPSLPNYKSKLDPRTNLKQQALAYLGKPAVATFDRKKNDYYRRLEDFNKSYFEVDWKQKYPDYNKRVKAQEAHAKKYGFDLQKDIYDDAWSRNDTPLTTGIKAQKAEARSFLSDFWKEYEKQPYGTKSIWVRDKMKEITKSGVVGKNRFIADGLPDWHSPDSIAKADNAEFWRTYWNSSKETRRLLMNANPRFVKFTYKQSEKQIDYLAAKSSGDWTAFHNKYGFRSEKQRLYYEAKKSGDWSKFESKYGRSTAQSEAAKFWTKYFKSSPAERDKLLAANPKYDKFKDEAPKTQEEWEKIMREVKAARKQRLLGDKKGRSFYNARLADARAEQPKIDRWLNTKRKKITWG